MANIVFGYKNLIDAAAVSGGNWLATLPLSNIKSPVLQRLARSANVQLASTRFDIDLSSAKGVGVLALVMHNLSVDAKVRISAADNASFVGTQGNLLSYTEDFSNALWTKDGVTLGSTVTANSITLTKLIETSGTNSGNGHKVLQTIACTPASTYALSFYARAGERSVVQQWSYGGTGSDATSAFFDASTGVATGTGSPSMTLVSPGLWRCQRTITTMAAQTSLSVGIGPSDGTGVQAYSGVASIGDGSLTAMSPASIAAGSGPSPVAISTDGASVYVVNVNSRTVSQYARNTSTGILSSIGTISTGSGPTGIVISRDGTSVYVANRGGSVSQYARNPSTGILASLGPLAVATIPAGIAISGDGKHVYVVNERTGAIHQYAKNPYLGTLVSIGDIATVFGLARIAITPDDKSVYVSIYSGNVLLYYSRNTSTGQLTLISNIQVVGGADIAISPDAKNVYLLYNMYPSGYVYQYARDLLTGALTLLGNAVTTWRVSQALAVSPDGKNVYVTNGELNYCVDNFSRDKATGRLTLVAGSVVYSTLLGIAVSPDGKNVYVANSGSGQCLQLTRSYDSVFGAYAGGTQLELGSIATSYLPILGLNSNPPDYQTAWTSVWPAGMVPQTLLEWEEDNFWLGTLSAEQRSSFQSPYLHLLATQQFYRYWRVEIDDAANSAGYVQIGRVFISPIWSPAVNFSWGDELAYEDTSPSTTALSGTQYFDNRPKPRVARLNFEALSKTEALDVALQIDRTLGISGELLQVPDRADAARIPATAFLATMRQTTPVVSVLADTYTKSYELREIL